ncbi:methyltransferase domain-containing protein [Tardiphaga sp. vice278]|uniref:methyltransferase domain-containing protein n=1 Tax=Tardiphaga sp. vice278 TaxID=2592815 RepID=UPI00143DB819|nr:methyltransferase domain-containing protein [Tardiphaga sp. vice278]
MNIAPEDIRPAALEEGKAREIQRDTDWLVARQPDFVAVKCPACGAAGKPAFEKFGFSFEDCPSCRTVFMSPRATPEIMAEFYGRSTNYEYWDKHVFPASRGVRKSKVFQPRVDRILALCDSHGLETGVAMDVGASVGIFCETLQETGRFRRVVALEPNFAQAESCRRLGLETLETDFFKLDSFDEPISLITAFEVIEHLFSAKAFLESCHQLLAPNGMVAVTCPNQLGFDIQTLGIDSLSFDVEHVNMFNPAALRELFEANGFSVLQCSTPGEMDASIVRDAVLAGQFSLAREPFLREVLLNQWDRLGGPFQSFLRDNGLSSHMWLVAIKRQL